MMANSSPFSYSDGDLAAELERAYTESDDLTLAQLRQILGGLAELRDAPGGLNAAAVAAVLSSCRAGGLPLESVDVLAKAVSDLGGTDPVRHLSLKKLEDLMSQIS